MGSSTFVILGLMWIPIAVSPIVLWGSRRELLARPNGRVELQALVGVNVAAAIVAVFLTLFSVGYESGKALALAENRADAAAAIN